MFSCRFLYIQRVKNASSSIRQIDDDISLRSFCFIQIEMFLLISFKFNSIFKDFFLLCFLPIYSNFQSFENLVSPTSQIDDNFPVFKPIFNFSKKLTRLSFSLKQMFFYQTNRLPFLTRIYFSLKQD